MTLMLRGRRLLRRNKIERVPIAAPPIGDAEGLGASSRRPQSSDIGKAFQRSPDGSCFVEGQKSAAYLPLGASATFHVALLARCFRVAVKCLLEFLDVGFKRGFGLCRSSQFRIDFMGPDFALLSSEAVVQ